MLTLAGSHAQYENNFRRILGIDFFGGSVEEAVERMKAGGLLVIPAAPALKDLNTNPEYREALLKADLCITDSSFMILIWNFIQWDHLRRLSGLAYLRRLLQEPDVRRPGNTLWIMANPKSARTNIAYLKNQGIDLPQDAVYMAPTYGTFVEDTVLIQRLAELHPRHVVMTIGGGAQERLGLYLKQHLDYLPAIHCTGAAIAFLSGDQVRIPMWADRFYLGWLYRCISEPGCYVPRYWGARKLATMMVRYRSKLPPVEG